jgi:hypothetical protein
MPERAGQKAEFSGILAELPEWGLACSFVEKWGKVV